MRINRVFTKDMSVHDVYDLVEWKTTTAEIKGSKFRQEYVEFPSFYSDNAINIYASKYFCGKIGTKEREHSMKQLIDRIVYTNALWGCKQGYFGDKMAVITSEMENYRSFYSTAKSPDVLAFIDE